MTPRYIAIIPAAGLGTRFLPVTRVVPKELLPIGGKPAFHHTLEELAQAGIFDVIVVTGPEKSLLRSYCSVEETAYDRSLHDQSLDSANSASRRSVPARPGLDAVNALKSFLKQFRFQWVMQEDPKGLGHAVLCAAPAAKGFWPIILLPDMIIDHHPNCVEQLRAVTAKTQRAVIAAHRVPSEHLSKYGVLDLKPSGTPRVSSVTHIIEKPAPEKAPSSLVVTGRYLLPPTIFEYLAETGRGHGGEIQLTDALNALAQHDGLDALEYQGVTLDTGEPEGWLAANLHFA